MKVINVNVNGIRAATRKGFFEWVTQINPDIICMQEIKAHSEQLDTNHMPKNYYHYLSCADKKGYSGVAIYSKVEPKTIIKNFGYPLAEEEGRFIQADFENFSIVSVYFPSGTTEIRQEIKYEFMRRFESWLSSYMKNNKKIIICGDWNIAHTNLDLKNWKNNQKSSGFLPEEKEWLGSILKKFEMVDSFRYLYPDKEQYTWWSNRANAWNNNVGWRIDYQMVSNNIKNNIIDAEVFRDIKFSDHAPLIHTYSLK